MASQKMRMALLTLFAAGAMACTSASATAAVNHGHHELAGKKVRTDTISIPGMQCGMCEKRISEKLTPIKGIEQVVADADAKHVIVSYQPGKITRSAIEKAIAAVGYDAGTATAANTAKERLPMCCRAQE